MFEVLDVDTSYKVYRLTCIDNGKVYIGVTKKSLASRWSGHVSSFNTNMDKGLPLNRLQKAFRVHGVENWSKEVILDRLTREEAFAAEIEQIAKHGSYGRKGYNATAGGVGQNSVAWTKYSRMKLSKSQKESWETREYKPSDITRKRMSEAKKKNHPRATKVMFRGVEYPSLREAERSTGVTLHKIQAELKDPEYIFYPERKPAGRPPKQYLTKDKLFSSRAEAAEFYKVSIHNLSGYLRRNNLDLPQPERKIDTVKPLTFNTRVF